MCVRFARFAFVSYLEVDDLHLVCVWQVSTASTSLGRFWWLELCWHLVFMYLPHLLLLRLAGLLFAVVPSTAVAV